MSDIPELDRLIEEAEIVRRNLAWERRDRVMRNALGHLMLGGLLLFPVGFLLGQPAAIVLAVLTLFSLAPAAYLAFRELLVACFTEPPRRDPTKRYKHR